MAGDSTGNGSSGLGNEATNSTKQGRAITYPELVLFQPFWIADEKIHPFLHLLRFASYRFCDEAFVEYTGSHETQEPFKPLMYPSPTTLNLPFEIPDSIKVPFLKTVQSIDAIDYPRNPYEDNTNVMDFAVYDWDHITSGGFYYLLNRIRDDKGNSSPVTLRDLWDSLERLWTVFPFCDYRVELIYRAYKETKKGVSFREQLSDRLDFENICFLQFAAQRPHVSENIALRFLIDERLKHVHASDKKLSARFKNTLKGKKQSSFFDDQYKDEYLKELSHIKEKHIGLKKYIDKNNPKRSYFLQIPRKKREIAGLHMTVPKNAEPFYNHYENLASGCFFAEQYFDLYREVWDEKLSLRAYTENGKDPLAHPLYLPSSMEGLIASITQDFYLMDNFNNFTLKKDGKFIDYCLSIVQRIHEDISLPLIHAFRDAPSENFSDVLEEHVTNLFLDPRACALYRILDLSHNATFEDKLGAISCPFDITDKRTLEKMDDLINWIDQTKRIDDGNRYVTEHINRRSFASFYLTSKISFYFCNLQPEEAKKVANIISYRKPDEIKSIVQCPEIILAAAFSPNFQSVFTGSFETLDKVPFHLLDKDMAEYRFGPKRILLRKQFMEDFPSLIAVSKSILSGEFADTLRKEMNIYCAPAAQKKQKGFKPSW